MVKKGIPQSRIKDATVVDHVHHDQKFYILPYRKLNLLIFSCFIFLSIFLVACGSRTPETTATPETISEQDQVWERVQAEGRLVVGTAADYPPFEYIDEDYQIVGLDIAIIKEIGRRLGFEVELRDMAFDGLGNALLVDQIDLAISAITVTAERRQYLGFSNVYYVSADSFIAAPDSQISSLSSAEQISQYRLGVESGTIYESWARTNLIESGLMPAENLFTYRNIGDALIDLEDGRIDLVAMDLQPAQVAQSEGKGRIVARGLNEQQFSIALPKGARQLQDQINRALFDMQSDGTLNELVTEYIGVESGAILPLPPPEPTSESEGPVNPPGPCVDSSEFVEQLSLDNAGFTNIPTLNAGESFQTGWRLRNSGTCSWNSGYLLAPVSGNNPASRMGGQPIPVTGEVPPGETYDFIADLVAPIDPGEYVHYWSMRNNSSGLLFGDRVSVAINVIQAATPTPPPTQTPVPGITFSATPQTVQQGQCSTLNWSTVNIQSVSLYEQGEDWQSNGVPNQGSLVVCPNATTTYELRVVLMNGSVETRQVTVFVVPNTAVPKITRFTVEPPDQITLGQCVTIQWIVEGSVNSVSISRNGVAIWPNAPFSGAMQDCPPNIGQQAYGLTATGPGGTSQAQWVINIVDSATPLPTSTATVAPTTPTPSTEPVIYFFNANPNPVRVNNCVTLSWNVGGNASRVSLLKNSQIVQENLSFHSSWSDCSTGNLGTVIYVLLASSPFNQTTTEQQSVNVTP